MPQANSVTDYRRIVDQLLLDVANQDVKLYRKSADTLGLDDDLWLASEKTIDGMDPSAHGADLDAHTKNLFEELRTGEYHITLFGGRATASLTANTLYALPLLVARDMTIDRIAIQVTSAGAAGTKARLGIYELGTNLYPGALLLDAGEVDVDGTGVLAITIDQALTKGIYFTAVVSDGTPQLRSVIADDLTSPLFGLLSTNFNIHHNLWSVAHTYAALPDPFTAGGSLGRLDPFKVPVRVASLD